MDFLLGLLPSGFLSDIWVVQNTQKHLFCYSHLCCRDTRPYQILPACASLSFAMVLAAQTKSCLHPLNLTLVDLEKTLHFPSVLHSSCWVGCPPTFPPQLNHAASAIPGGHCRCPPAFPSLVCAHGASLTSTAQALWQTNATL